MLRPSPSRNDNNNSVALIQDSGPFLASSRTTYPQDEDDSLQVVFSAETGAGRAHTPQRLNRTNTPQRPRSSSLLSTAPAPVRISAPFREEGEGRRQPLSRRKQRRWDNDNLIGVEKLLRGRHAHEESEANHLTVTVSRRSSLSALVSDQNTSESAKEARESVRKGLQPTRSAEEESARKGVRRFAGGRWEDAEERFLLVERRLRDIFVRALRNSAILSFVVGLETLLEAFAEHQHALAPADIPSGLSSALTAGPKVEIESSRDGATNNTRAATLLVPLGPSPFHRLLLHALCQYGRFRSKSEETGNGRIVRVNPLPHKGNEGSFASTVPMASLSQFIIETRLRDTSSATREVSKAKTASAPCAIGLSTCREQVMSPMPMLERPTTPSGSTVGVS